MSENELIGQWENDKGCDGCPSNNTSYCSACYYNWLISEKEKSKTHRQFGTRTTQTKGGSSQLYEIIVVVVSFFLGAINGVIIGIKLMGGKL